MLPTRLSREGAADHRLDMIHQDLDRQSGLTEFTVGDRILRSVRAVSTVRVSNGLVWVCTQFLFCHRNPRVLVEINKSVDTQQFQHVPYVILPDS